jgi:hypothetical protein
MIIYWINNYIIWRWRWLEKALLKFHVFRKLSIQEIQEYKSILKIIFDQLPEGEITRREFDNVQMLCNSYEREFPREYTSMRKNTTDEYIGCDLYLFTLTSCDSPQFFNNKTTCFYTKRSKTFKESFHYLTYPTGKNPYIKYPKKTNMDHPILNEILEEW